MSDSKIGKLVSARVPQGHIQSYAELMAAAGLTVSEGVRTHIQQMVVAYEKLNLDTVKVACTFKWRSQRQAHFPEHAGDLMVVVTSTNHPTASDLERIVFELPEFLEDPKDAREPCRIDSFYFHRVNNGRGTAISARVQRNVLSFRLINGKWRAGIFDYEGAGNELLEEKIRPVVIERIQRTIGCFLLGILPESRLLEATEVAQLNSSIMSGMLGEDE